MLGSDFPFPLGEQQVGSLIRSHTGLPAATRERLLHTNARHFFGLDEVRAGSHIRRRSA
jgi:aminocarboxymuconate-semialdehyde decarboxylase